MKYVLEALRMIFISFEFIFALVVFLLHQQNPHFFTILGDSLTGDSEITKWLPAIPLGLSIYCFVDLIWKLITPLSASNRELYDWPDFWRLKIRCYFSLILSAVCAAVALSIWIFSKAISHEWIGVLFLFSVGLALINAGCMAFASFAIRIIMEPKGKSDSGS
jgi:hypothetical protein